MVLTKEQMMEMDHCLDLLEAEADDRLIILPCKVGDTVWVNVPNMQGSDNIRIFKATVINFLFDKLGILVYCEYRNYGCCSCYGRIGKTVFSTRAEAEAALRGGGDG